VDYGRPLEELVRGWGFDYVDPQINSKNSRPQPAGKVVEEILLVDSTLGLALKDALHEHSSHGLTPETLWELLAIPKIHLPDGAAALGSVFHRRFRGDFAPHIYYDPSGGHRWGLNLLRLEYSHPYEPGLDFDEQCPDGVFCWFVARRIQLVTCPNCGLPFRRSTDLSTHVANWH
jgi:hypothetical protein